MQFCLLTTEHAPVNLNGQAIMCLIIMLCNTYNIACTILRHSQKLMHAGGRGNRISYYLGWPYAPNAIDASGTSLNLRETSLSGHLFNKIALL